MKAQRNQRRSIYSRLLLVISASLLLALFVVGVAVARQIYHDEERGLLEKLRFSGELLANRTVAALVFNDAAAVNANIASAHFIPSVIKLCVYSANLTKIAEYLGDEKYSGCDGRLESATIAQQNYVDRYQAWVVLPVQDAGVTLGHLKLVATTDLIKEKVHNTLVVVATILLSAMVLAFGLGWGLLRTAMTPLKKLGKDVKRISDEPFSSYRPAKFYNDEVGDLVDAFNLMLDALTRESLAQKKAQTELERLALYDPLTNLPNRRFFHDHLHYQIAAASKHNQSFAILMIDLDNFKRVNDSMGHDAGDHLLKVLGERLHNCCFAEDVVSRLGGDEFIVLLDNKSKLVINDVAERLQKAINMPVEFQHRTIEIRSSIGVAIFPDDATNARDLLKSADIALYRAKAVGRNCMVYFSSELDQAVQERVALEFKLQQALKNEQLSLYLQPQIEGRTQTPVWCEALLRWRDAEYGFVSPAQFIPIAEESGLIIEIGNWVLQETCRQWSKYGQQLMAIGIQGISVNLSARQFYTKDLVETTLGILQQFGISPRHIAFEITESLVMENVEQAMLTLRELRSNGFQISIDDFGTGYSSLAYLKLFTIDYLKIDKSFVDGLPHDPNDMAITTAIIAMAQQLDIGIVAEGVETEQQMLVLIAHGCERMQGYFFSRPVPVEDLLAFYSPRLAEVSANKNVSVKK
ncbi:MAG: EAL domain-containing protein [Spongiibacteraceae bacterium]